jgi:hypothetical protein
MISEYASLHATSLNREQHEQTCGYWYVVRNGAMAHTAFATRAGLDRWLSERGLALENELPEPGEWGTTRVVGSYRERCYLYDAAEFDQLRPVLATAVMSNGDYTLGLVTEGEAGQRTVHYLNPNVRTRFVFDHAKTREVMS